MESIPCPHDSGSVPYYKTAPDHHPLTKEEIARLLEEAKDDESQILVAKVQIRLHQGIPGQVCPREISGPIADKECEINKLFVGNYRKGADPKLVDQLYEIITR